MDQEKFDKLVQKLSADASRRGVVRGVMTGAVGSALAAVGLQSADAKKKGGAGTEACTANGKRCGKNSGKRGRPCKKCCSRNSVEAGKGRRCACVPLGGDCSNDSQCCEGICIGGTCGFAS